jgi:hypothetical protein
VSLAKYFARLTARPILGPLYFPQNVFISSDDTFPLTSISTGNTVFGKPRVSKVAPAWLHLCYFQNVLFSTHKGSVLQIIDPQLLAGMMLTKTTTQMQWGFLYPGPHTIAFYKGTPIFKLLKAA